MRCSSTYTWKKNCFVKKQSQPAIIFWWNWPQMVRFIGQSVPLISKFVATNDSYFTRLQRTTSNVIATTACFLLSSWRKWGGVSRSSCAGLSLLHVLNRIVLLFQVNFETRWGKEERWKDVASASSTSYSSQTSWFWWVRRKICNLHTYSIYTQRIKGNSSHSKNAINFHITVFHSAIKNKHFPFPFCFILVLILGFIKAISVRNVWHINSSANHVRSGILNSIQSLNWLMSGACGLCADPRRNEFLVFFRRNDKLSRENGTFLRLGSVFRRMIFMKAVIRQGLQESYLSSKPHVEGELGISFNFI